MSRRGASSWRAFHGIVAVMRVLVADDDDGVLMAITLLLEREGISTTRATSPERVLEALSRAGAAPFDAMLLDLNYERDTTSGEEGFTLLSRLRTEHPSVRVVVMTGWASIEGAVEAMRRGAVDYLPKPWDNARLVALLRGLGSAATPAVSGAERESRFRLSPLMQRLHGDDRAGGLL
jgi:DNA-binding NtrC family response regulator